MGKLFKNLKPYWKSVLMIVVLLMVQAFCDLSLPQYTSDIIDTGIQNSGWNTSCRKKSRRKSSRTPSFS